MGKSSEANVASNPAPAPQQRSNISSASDRLTNSELQLLRQIASEQIASALKPFSHLRPSLLSEQLTPSEIESLWQDSIESDTYFQKAFAHLRRKV
jgi:hypothetical protein